MKKIILTICAVSLYVSTTAIAADQFMRPNEQRIAQRVIKIEQEEKHNMYVRHALIAACVGLVGYGIYNNYINPKVEIVPTEAQELAKLTARIDALEKHLAVTGGYGWWLEEKLNSGVQGFILQMAVFISMGYVGEKMTKKKHNVEAFLINHTRLNSTLSALIEHTKVKQRKGIDVQQQLVCMAYNNVVEDIEQLIAYVEYRARGMDAEKAQAAICIARTLYSVTDTLGNELEQEQDKTLLAKSTVVFKETIYSLVSTFMASFDRDEMVTESA